MVAVSADDGKLCGHANILHDATEKEDGTAESTG